MRVDKRGCCNEHFASTSRTMSKNEAFHPKETTSTTKSRILVQRQCDEAFTNNSTDRDLHPLEENLQGQSMVSHNNTFVRLAARQVGGNSKENNSATTQPAPHANEKRHGHIPAIPQDHSKGDGNGVNNINIDQHHNPKRHSRDKGIENGIYLGHDVSTNDQHDLFNKLPTPPRPALSTHEGLTKHDLKPRLKALIPTDSPFTIYRFNNQQRQHDEAFKGPPAHAENPAPEASTRYMMDYGGAHAWLGAT